MNIEEAKEILWEDFDHISDDLIEELIKLIWMVQDYVITEALKSKKRMKK